MSYTLLNAWMAEDEGVAEVEVEVFPIVVLPDMAPLIHLAAAGRLNLLQAFGRVVVMDIVANEASDDLSRPWAPEVAQWLAAGTAAGSAMPVEVADTGIGEAYRLARRADPPRFGCGTPVSWRSSSGCSTTFPSSVDRPWSSTKTRRYPGSSGNSTWKIPCWSRRPERCCYTSRSAA